MLSQHHPNEIPVYSRLPIRPVRAAACTVWDEDGNAYLDMYGGHAVSVVGHCHPRVVAAIARQAEQLVFYSNAVHLAAQEALLDRLGLVAPAGLDRVFLVNSGAEANDNALGLARRMTGRAQVVTFSGGFHGRSLATLAVSGIPRYRALAESGGAGSELVRYTKVCEFGDEGGAVEAIDSATAAVIVEPIQGLAGANAAAPGFLAALRAACDRAGALLIFDEVQCGCGRSGAFTAAARYGVTPDLLTIGKGIAGGIPMGVVLASQRVAAAVKAGELGTTFGGGPVASAAGAATIDVILQENLPERAVHGEKWLRAALKDIPGVRGVRGLGLLLGVELDRPAKAVQAALFERRILTGSAEDAHVLRLLPPLVVTDAELGVFAETLLEVMS